MRSLPSQAAPPQEPTVRIDEAALTAMRTAADKLLEPQPTLPAPRGSSLGFSPEPSASARPQPHASPLAPPSLGPCGSRPETPCQRVTCARPLVIELCCGTALLSSVAQEAGYAVLPIDWGHNKHKPYVRALQMDLRSPSTWAFLRHVCETRPIAWIHVAPPCGTASRKHIRLKLFS